VGGLGYVGLETAANEVLHHKRFKDPATRFTIRLLSNRFHWCDAFVIVQPKTGRGAFVPLTFAPGEAFRFDSSEDFAVIGGEKTKLMVAQFKLCYSRAFMLQAYPYNPLN